MQDQGQCRVRGQESKIRVIPRARVQGLEQGSRSGFNDQGQSSRVRAVPLARVRVKYRSRLSISIRGQQSNIVTIPRARVQGQDQDKGKEQGQVSGIKDHGHTQGKSEGTGVRVRGQKSG